MQVEEQRVSSPQGSDFPLPECIPLRWEGTLQASNETSLTPPHCRGWALCGSGRSSPLLQQVLCYQNGTGRDFPPLGNLEELYLDPQQEGAQVLSQGVFAKESH